MSNLKPFEAEEREVRRAESFAADDRLRMRGQAGPAQIDEIIPPRSKAATSQGGAK